MHLPAAVLFGLLSIILSISIITRLCLKKYRSGSHFFWHLAGSVLSAVFLYQVLPWAFTSYYLRDVFLLGYIISLVYIIIRTRRNGYNTDRPLGKIYLFGRIPFVLLVGFLVGYFFSGRYYKGEAVALKFPFRSGQYYVMQGGANRIVNPAHRNFSLQKYGFAMDISKIFSNGNRANSLFPTKVSDFAIYGDTILSPCDGKIILVVDTVHTNAPGQVNTKWVHGNHVFIQADHYRVFMAHFIKNKIFVKEGDWVKAGQPIGISGNSGFSIEPHLHLNVFKNYDTVPYLSGHSESTGARTRQAAKYDDYRYSGTSVPFTFEGKFYIMNDIMSK